MMAAADVIDALECHLGYAREETDRHDMRLLSERFGLRLRPTYG